MRLPVVKPQSNFNFQLFLMKYSKTKFISGTTFMSTIRNPSAKILTNQKNVDEEVNNGSFNLISTSSVLHTNKNSSSYFSPNAHKFEPSAN